MSKQGLFITFEGGEGCGKSTQAASLYQRLQRTGVPAVLTYEPGGTPLGTSVRDLLKKRLATAISPVAELLLFNVSRAQLVAEIIRPSLDGGKTVICDRFADSTVAYQGYGRGIDITTVRAVNRLGTDGLKPDLTILLDIPPEKGLPRKNSRRDDRFEREAVAFHRRVREGYLKMAEAEPRRWLVIDGTLPRAEIRQRIWNAVSARLSQPVILERAERGKRIPGRGARSS